MTSVPSASVSETLAGFVSTLKYDELPGDVSHQAKLSTLDFLGVALAGCETDTGRVIAEYVRRQAGVAESTVLGHEFKVPRAAAALANGTLAHSVELDDHEAHKRSKVHPGVTVMPAAWAVSESAKVSGREFLVAVVLGYDVIGRLSAATSYPNFLGRERGFHTTPVFGPFAAGAVAARLLGLSVDQIAQTFGTIGSLASGLSETMETGSWTKRLHAGWAGHGGMIAAELASAGFTGPRTVFEGRRGFYRAFCGEGNFDLSVVTQGLGDEFDISLIMYKPYACAGGMHSTLAAVEQLRSSSQFSVDEIKKVSVFCDTHGIEAFANPREAKYNPRTGAQAQFSLPYAVATLLVDGVALVDQFSDAAVSRIEVVKLAQLVECQADPEFDTGTDEDAEPARVVITLSGGRTIEATVPGAKGSLAVPMSTEDIQIKFRSLAVPVIGAEAASVLEDTVLRLEEFDEVGHIPQLLARKGVRAA